MSAGRRGDAGPDYKRAALSCVQHFFKVQRGAPLIGCNPFKAIISAGPARFLDCVYCVCVFVCVRWCRGKTVREGGTLEIKEEAEEGSSEKLTA